MNMSKIPDDFTFIDEERDIETDVYSYYEVFFGKDDTEEYKIQFLADTFQMPAEKIQEIINEKRKEENE